MIRRVIVAGLLLMFITLAENRLLNVLFVMSDDLRPDIGVFTSPDEPYFQPIKTPNFDRFADDSLVLTRGYVQLSLCSPSRASALTGKTHHLMLRFYKKLS